MFSLSTKFSPASANFEKAIFAGYENAELYMTPTRLMSWKSLSKIARSFDLNYVLHFPTEGKIGSQTCEEIVRLARDLGCQIIVVHEEQLDDVSLISSLDPGIRLAVENKYLHFNDLDEWIASHEFVTLDIEHLWKNTLHDCDLNSLCSVVRSLLKKHNCRIQHIHLPGYLPGQAEQKPMYCSREMVFSMFDILYEEQYGGWVVGELDENFQNQHEMKMDLLLFETWKSKVSSLPLLNSVMTQPPFSAAEPS